ncbi:glycosyltransferase [Desulfocurvibacter africanus PCS]|uniref:Glycosyltransferase n=1 Tax=Desulfocurvibacter africanus PCS TaxID=1262666 RepID=M5PWT0_DESAF|nr:glycosyltransferase [Desulfocurvibacter africanus]EMG38440.1 glycosyltransferase [Desulfocurvibacter africanus PCS]
MVHKALSQSVERKLLNLGCGRRFHPDWTNADFQATGPGVIACDLNKGIPFPSASFDVVYHSHLLEHFPRRKAPAFLSECFRVLKPGGVLRVVVPDLEDIVRNYLQALEQAADSDPEGEDRHEWMTIELLDQLVRHEPGGQMLKHWKRVPMPAEEFVIERMGAEVRGGLAGLRRTPAVLDDTGGRQEPSALGAFRLSGEVHQWMYDRISLTRLLQDAGFVDIVRLGAGDSAISGFQAYGLDLEPDGSVRKPDSLFMEAVKPMPERRRAPQTVRSKPLKVAHFALWGHGGAGIAATRLHDGLRATGVDSRMYVLSKQGDDPSIEVVPSRQGELLQKNGKIVSPSLARHSARWHAILARYPNRSQYLEAFTDILSDTRLASLKGFQDADIINLHWVGGIIDFEHEVEALASKPVVWTMHDMNPLTGGCHYSGGCERYALSCGSCPLLGSLDKRDASERIWAKKRATFDLLDLTCVTPSKWLGDCAGKSSLWRGRARHVIPYGLNTDVFKLGNQEDLRKQLGIPRDSFLVFFGAESVANQRKGFMHSFNALRSLRERLGSEGIALAIIGHCPSELAAALPFQAYQFGYVNSPEDMAKAYSLADVCILPSLEDNLPNVGIESLACGTPVVGFRIGGVPDIVTHMETGYLAGAGDVGGLCDGLVWALEQKRAANPVRLQCRKRALEEFNLLKQAKAYTELYESILAEKKR